MKRKLMILSIFLVSLLAVSAVSATENVTSDVVGSEDLINQSVEGDVLKTSPKSFSDLYDAIYDNRYDDVYLDSDYAFNLSSDSDFRDGIYVDRDVTIHGNGFTISGENTARIFKASSNIVFRDIVFTKGLGTNGGAICGVFTAINCTFIDNHANFEGGAIDGQNRVYKGMAVNCTFINNSAGYCGAMDMGIALNCTFENISECFTVEYNNGETVSLISDRIEVDITNEKLILK